MRNDTAGFVQPTRRAMADTTDVLGDLDAMGVASLIRLGEISQAEAVEAAILRAEAVNGSINAIAYKAYEAAKRAKPVPKDAVFTGVPTFYKDSDPIEGWPMQSGSRTLGAHPAQSTSPFIKQFNALGCVPLGCSAMPEFGSTATTESSLMGATRNPHSLDHICGGSSGGAAALVAAKVVPITHGNDGGGSIRIPASACGVIGLKPSRGRTVGVDFPSWFPVNIVHQGVITKSMRDTHAAITGLQAYAERNGLQDPSLTRISDTFTATDGPLRIGVYVDPGNGIDCDSQCKTATLAAAQACADLGHRVELIPNPYSSAVIDDFMLSCWGLMQFVISKAGKSFFSKDFDATKLEEFSKYMARWFRNNMLSFFPARKRLRAFVEAYNRPFATYDVLLSPTLATPVPEIGYLGPDVPPPLAYDRVLGFAPFALLHNISGAPAISLPMAQANNGTPIGVMFAGKLGDDQKLMELGLQLEQDGHLIGTPA